jgi:hypothetical protein
MLGDEAEIAASPVYLDASDAVDRACTGRWAAQAARTGLKVGGRQLPNPVTNSNQAIGYVGDGGMGIPHAPHCLPFGWVGRLRRTAGPPVDASKIDAPPSRR